MKPKDNPYKQISINSRLVSSLFTACLFSLFNCADEKHKPVVQQRENKLPAITLVKGLVKAKTTSFFKKEKTNAREGDLETSCILDGMLWDECPIGIDGDGLGGGGGGNTDPLTVFPDFDPGAINVDPNPAHPGQEVGIAFIVANHRGLKFPAGSLQFLDGVDSGIRGVHISVHLLSNDLGNNAPNENNKGFIGVFDPVTISPDDYYISLSMTLPSNLTQGKNYRIAVVVDPENNVPELDNTNNLSIDAQELFIISPPSDLIPVLSEPSLSASTVAVGEGFTVGCKVKNIGNSLSSTSFKIKYTAHLVGGDELANPITLGTVTHTINTQPLATNGLTPKLSKTVAIGIFGGLVPGQVGLAPGDYIVKATVDSDNQITEGQTGETNNVLSLGPLKVVTAGSKPDLIDPGGVRAYVPNDEVLPGGAVSIQMSVKNNGTSDAGTFVINYYLSEDNNFSTSDPFLCALEVGGAAMIPGETRTFTVQGQVPPNTSPGLYQVWWFIDANGSVNESKEDNNKIQAEDAVDNRLLVQGPDFKGGKSSLKSHTVIPGKSFILTLDVSNLGKVASTNFTVFIDIYLSTDTTLDISVDRKISTINLGTFGAYIPALETVTQQKKYINIPISTIPILGQYLLYNIDPPSSSNPRGVELEINETNNSGNIGLVDIVYPCDAIDVLTATHIFTDAVLNIDDVHSFCNYYVIDSYDEWPWSSANSFLVDAKYFKKKKETLNGKYCSDKFYEFYNRWMLEVSNLIPLLKSACGSQALQYANLPLSLKTQVDEMASQFVGELETLKRSCNSPSGGVLQPTTGVRVYCGCPNVNYLSDLPGFDPGTSSCLSPN